MLSAENQKNINQIKNKQMKNKKEQFYAVWVGRTVDVFTDWKSAEKSIKGFSNAKCRKFDDYIAAFRHLNEELRKLGKDVQWYDSKEYRKGLDEISRLFDESTFIFEDDPSLPNTIDFEDAIDDFRES
ncbi:MAG: RNase H1/viroplasmin domain-containing protein [Bacteroidota bacterium]|nr:RNase H1/viroplasmin domain-containing protein [Bacteroidota bacterium]